MFPDAGSSQPRPEALFGGRYAVDGALSWGGPVTYYRAWTDGSPVILCVFPMDVSTSLPAEASFAHLAHQLGAASSNALPKVLDAAVIDGVPYIAFEDVRGTLLSDLLPTRPLRPSEVLQLAEDVLDALQTGHALGLVHGDLTPHNVIVSRDPNGGLRARVVGMGTLPLLRRFPECTPHGSHRGSGQFAIAYAAPERIGDGPTDATGDLYAVGALLHHMLTGSPPVGWETDEAFDTLPGLQDIVRRAMGRRPTDRYTSAAAMQRALDWIQVDSGERVRVPRSSHPPGKVLTASGARPIPVAPVVVEEVHQEAHLHRVRLGLLIVLLATLVLYGHLEASRSASTGWWTPAGPDFEVNDAR